MNNQPSHAPTLTISLHGWQWFLIGIIVAVALFGLSACYQGRKISRLTGLPVHIKLPSDVESYSQIVSISFHKSEDGETIKDVTYIGNDGKMRSHEFNDWGIFQGEIVWDLDN